MARITDYASLKTAIAAYLHRSDSDSYVDYCIQACETKLNRNLRLRQMETALSGTISSGVMALPSDYVEMKVCYIYDSGKARFLTRSTPEDIYRRYPDRSSTGTPAYFATQGGNLIFGPAPDQSYTVNGSYYARLPALSDSNTTNFFTDNHPDVLLYGALLEARAFLLDDPRLPVWKAMYDEAVAQVAAENKAAEFSGSSLAEMPY